MALVKLTFQPGFNRDWTNYANSGGWYDGDLVRFRNGLPETIGGWTKVTDEVLQGVCRAMWSWTALDGSELTGFGTHLKYYVENGGVLTDITPIRITAAAIGTDPFASTSGSTTIVVTDSAHAAGLYDFVTFAGATTFAGIPAAELNAEHQIITVVDNNTYHVVVTTAANATTTGGGASVTTTYPISVGPQTDISGTGWGAGVWGGAASPRLSATLGTDPIDTTNTDATVNISHTAHGAVTGDSIVMSGATSTGGVPDYYLNRVHEVTYVDDDNYTIEALTVATSPVAGGGAAVMVKYFQESDVGWGDPAADGAITVPRLWSADNYGEDLIICPRDKPLYYWDKSAAGVAVVFSAISGMDAVAPTLAKQVMVSSARHVIAFATDTLGDAVQDPLLISWATTENYKVWNPLTTNSAGSLRLENGSYFVAALETRQEILIWTDTALHSMQFLGPPYTYGVNVLSANSTIYGPKAMISAMGVVFWMGTDNFYMYDGRLATIPCTVWDYVFNDINRHGSFQVQCGTNRAFGEIWWHYPSASSTENNRYVIYNYAAGIWYFGTSIQRTAWLDRGFEGKPRATDADGVIYYHEDGLNDASATTAAALSPYIEGSPMEIADGEQFMFIWRVIPDVTFRASTNPAPTATLSLTPRDHPADALGTVGSDSVVRSSAVSATVERHTNQLDIRTRGRSMIYKLSSSALDVGWRMGLPRIDARPDGKR